MDIYNLYKQIRQDGILVTITSNRERYIFQYGILTCKIANGVVKAIVLEPAGIIKSLPAYAETDSLKESETW